MSLSAIAAKHPQSYAMHAGVFSALHNNFVCWASWCLCQHCRFKLGSYVNFIWCCEEQFSPATWTCNLCVSNAVLLRSCSTLVARMMCLAHSIPWPEWLLISRQNQETHSHQRSTQVLHRNLLCWLSRLFEYPGDMFLSYACVLGPNIHFLVVASSSFAIWRILSTHLVFDEVTRHLDC